MSRNSRIGEHIHIASIDELLGVPESKGCEELLIDDLHAFNNHPFYVEDDEKMTELVDSIRDQGVLTPVIVRKDPEGGYELISGHRRTHAAKIAGLKTIPAIVKELDDDEATILMVDANIQREEILPSEKAFAFKMKYDAISHQGASFGHNVQRWSHDEIGESYGVSGRQVQRYIRLTQLVSDLLKLVDQKKLSLILAVDMSYLKKETQEYVYGLIVQGKKISSEQIALLRYKEEKGEENPEINAQPVRKAKKKISLKTEELSKYFEDTEDIEFIRKTIYGLLDKWKGEQDGI